MKRCSLEVLSAWNELAITRSKQAGSLYQSFMFSKWLIFVKQSNCNDMGQSGRYVFAKFLIAKMQRVNVLSNTAMHSCPHQDNFMNENAAKVGMEHSVEFYLPRRIFKL